MKCPQFFFGNLTAVQQISDQVFHHGDVVRFCLLGQHPCGLVQENGGFILINNGKLFSGMSQDPVGISGGLLYGA